MSAKEPRPPSDAFLRHIGQKPPKAWPRTEPTTPRPPAPTGTLSGMGALRPKDTTREMEHTAAFLRLVTLVAEMKTHNARWRGLCFFGWALVMWGVWR
jgi:hypothetical protein